MKIGLQNFQSIGEYIEIPIAPITLFYGPNSAGKSSIADAIRFLRDTLESSGIPSEQLNRHARSNRKSHPLEKNFKGKADDVFFTIASYFDLNSAERCMSELGIFGEFSYELELFFKKPMQFEYQLFFSQYACEERSVNDKWYLRKSILLVGGVPLFKFTDDGSGKGALCEIHGAIAFNTEHPSWEELDKLFENGFDAALMDLVDECTLGHEVLGSDNEADTFDYKDENVDRTHSAIWLCVMDQGFGNPWSFNPFFDFPGRNPTSSESRNAKDFINVFMVMPRLSAARACVITDVPPIRSPKWTGLEGDIGRKILGLDSPALDFVNHALSSADFLDTGYALTGNVTLELDANKAISNLLHCDRETLLEKLRGIASINVHPYLVDQSRNSPIEIADVGVGISQVIPVLYACWYLSVHSGVTHIQQPELHLHPKLQAQLADVFIKALHDRATMQELTWERRQRESMERQRISDERDTLAKLSIEEESDPYKLIDIQINLGNALAADAHAFRRDASDTVADIFNPIHFLLESHSEHFLLRLLRRIRETHQTENATERIVDLGKVRSRSLNADQVSVVYVAKDKNGLAKMRVLRLADDGEFIDRWPGGFFTERDKELFGDEEPFP